MMRRRLLLTAAVLLLGVLALLATAGVEWGTPLRAERFHAFAVADMQSIGSQPDRVSDSAAWFKGADAQSGRSLLLARELNLTANEWPMLSLRFERFPEDLRLFLVWRSSASPQRLQAFPLPRPGRSALRVDLAQVSAWSGTITELGLMIAPADLLHLEDTLNRRFALATLALESNSVSGDLASLASEWRAYRPWMGRSINTAGFELGGAPTRSLVFVLGSCALGFALFFALMSGSRGSGFRKAVLLALLAAWLLLDLQFVAQGYWRGDFTRQAHRRGIELAVDPALSAAIERLRPLLEEAATQPVLVGSAIPFHRTYGAYELLPLVSVAIDSPSLAAGANAGVTLVLIGQGDWQYNQTSSRLTWSGKEFAAESIYADAQLTAYRLPGPEPSEGL
jgi:hypothetical protein